MNTVYLASWESEIGSIGTSNKKVVIEAGGESGWRLVTAGVSENAEKLARKAERKGTSS